MFPLYILVLIIVVITSALTMASKGEPLKIAPGVSLSPTLVHSLPNPPVAAVRAPVAIPGPIWCDKSRRWRDPVTKRYVKFNLA